MKYWKTKTGEKIAVKDMGDKHLINSAKILARNGYDWKDYFLSELTKRKIDIEPIEEESNFAQDAREEIEECEGLGGDLHFYKN